MGRYLADAVDRVSQHNRILQSQDQREAETIGAIRSKGIQRICRGLFERDVVTCHKRDKSILFWLLYDTLKLNLSVINYTYRLIWDA